MPNAFDLSAFVPYLALKATRRWLPLGLARARGVDDGRLVLGRLGDPLRLDAAVERVGALLASPVELREGLAAMRGGEACVGLLGLTCGLGGVAVLVLRLRPSRDALAEGVDLSAFVP